MAEFAGEATRMQMAAAAERLLTKGKTSLTVTPGAFLTLKAQPQPNRVLLQVYTRQDEPHAKAATTRTVPPPFEKDHRAHIFSKAVRFCALPGSDT
jgi:hypothetical protein